MRRKTLPSQSVLLRLFHYESKTGVILWRVRTDVSRSWNTRYAGTPAGSDCGHGYLKVSIGKRLFYVHHIAWALAYGSVLPDEIDHVNGDRQDNRLVNLRASVRAQNARNVKVSKRSSTGVRGVFPLPSGRFCARIGYAGKDTYLGSYDTLGAAAKAYATAANTLHGEFARPTTCDFS